MHHDYERVCGQAASSFLPTAEPETAEPGPSSLRPTNLQPVQSYPRRRARSDCFLLGQDRRGNWVAIDRDGRCGGLFVSKEAARAYALVENGNRTDAVEIVPGLELGPRLSPSAARRRLPELTSSDEI
jgi:hypothetical protein